MKYTANDVLGKRILVDSGNHLYEIDVWEALEDGDICKVGNEGKWNGRWDRISSLNIRKILGPTPTQKPAPIENGLIGKRVLTTLGECKEVIVGRPEPGIYLIESNGKFRMASIEDMAKWVFIYDEEVNNG